MQHNAAFHQGLHCFLRLKQPSGTEIHHDLETSTCDPIKCKMSNPIPIVSLCTEKFISIQRVNQAFKCPSTKSREKVGIKKLATVVKK